MTPEEFHTNVLMPALKKTASFAPEMPTSRGLEVLMVSISGYEANWTHRVQNPSGMAHGLFQMQLNDIEDIMANPASAKIFELGMKEWGINNQTAEHLFGILATPEGDSMAVFLARLNLWCDPHPIPAADVEADMYAYYLDTWRPGAKNPKRFSWIYGQALSAVPIPQAEEDEE